MGLSRAMTACALAPRRARISVRSRSRIRLTAALAGLISSLPRYRRTVKPRKSKPSSRVTMRVLSSLKASPLGASHAASRALACSACCLDQHITTRRVGGGISPPAARRTVRKPLGLHGSHRPAVRFEAEAPVSEQGREAPGDPGQELFRSSFASAQPFVLPASPAHQMFVDTPQEGIQHRLVEAAVIVDPALHDAVEHLREVGEGLVTAPGNVPGPHFPAHRLDRVLADRREEVHKVLPPLVLGQPRTECVPQERYSKPSYFGSPWGGRTSE